MRRLLPLALTCCLASSCAATALLGYQLRPHAPDDLATETRALPGLSAPVHVTFDALGVPHLEAENDVDLARAHGFAQGRARGFQLDLLRRVARGRVAELVGEQPQGGSTTVEQDRLMRGWNLEGRAREALALQPPPSLAALTAFAEGVNAAVQAWTPIEYRLLGVTPEPWTPLDSLAVGLLTAWSITHDYQQETARLLLAMHAGPARMDALYPAEPVPGARSLTAKAPLARELPPSLVPELEGLFPVHFQAPPAPPPEPAPLEAGGASNAWAVSGARTRSGKPLVANDPHLAHLLPSILVQAHLKAPGLDVIGATVPGLPWLLTGHNARVAWGMTSAMADVTDLVLEREDAQHPGFVLREGPPCPLTVRTERLRIHRAVGDEERDVTFRETCHGVLLNDLHPALFPPGAPLVALRWHLGGLERSLDAILAMDRADSVRALGEAVGRLPGAANAFTAADVEGHLGLFISGEVPGRPHHRGTFPVPGWLARYEWTDAARGAQLPHEVDPPRGLLAHANNTVLDARDGDAAPLHVDAAPPYRVERITALLEATPRHDLATFRRLQADVRSSRAVRLAPVLLAAVGDGAWLGTTGVQARALLARWDFEARADRPEAAIFFVAYRYALEAALDDELPAPARQFFLSQRYSTGTADAWFLDPRHPVWDDTRTPAPERRDEVLRQAFARAVDELTRTQGPDATRWRWGALHTQQARHPFGGRAGLQSFNLPERPAGGELDTVWKAHFDLGQADAPFRVVAGPVYRSVVDLADVAHGWWVVDTGASGWPRTQHARDQQDAWQRGELLPMLMDVDEVRRGVHGELTLLP